LPSRRLFFLFCFARAPLRFEAPSHLFQVRLVTFLFFSPMTSDQTVSVGGTVTLTCWVAETDNSSLQWSNTAQQTLYFGEKRALRDNRIQLHRSTPTELSITISDVQLSDEGEYTCSIFTMPVRTARATVTVLGVPATPQISGFEEPVPAGGKVTLTCTTTGSKPPAKLRWYKGGVEIQGRPDVVESVPDEPTYNVSSELTLQVNASDDNVIISCVVDHDSVKPGEKKSEQSLRVLYTPEVAITPEERLAIEGQRFSLQCSGKGNPDVFPFFSNQSPPCLVLQKKKSASYICWVRKGIGMLVFQLLAFSSYYPAPFSPLSPAHWVTLSFLFFSHPTGTYLTHEAKGSDDAPDADTAIINAEGGHSGAEEKKEYFI
uniref:Cell adhesion molecule 3 n=1 Tax=Fundulus heteroclitus TaxID=8078 RepID=A0A3Q2QB65_FUNHE